MVSKKFAWALMAGSVVVALAIVGCGEPKSGVSKENKEYRAQTKDAPKWVNGDLNKIKVGNKEYSSVFLGRGEDDIVEGDVGYATDQAAAAARANLATNLKSELIKDVQSQANRNGKSLDKNSSVSVNEKVDRVLVASKPLARWVGKDKVWVLVGLDQGIVSKIRSELGLQ
ncbi:MULTISPECIES: LPP20 family lipoprotein [Helicobacter]|uniref:LPP20 family lipoprotein n=1 Tax=Helicobacter TaxID=209 RepID=UPI000EAF0F64|nr:MULTISPECIES: LPP20 family lipoprotein [Helicobacter]